MVAMLIDRTTTADSSIHLVKKIIITIGELSEKVVRPEP